MTTSIDQFVSQRAMLLARVVLTRRPDVHVLTLGDREDVDIDLMARIKTPIPDLPVIPYFGVVVKGTADPLVDKKAANRMANHVRPMPARAFFLAPIVLMCFSMERDRGYWAWVMEPSVDGPDGPSLEYRERLEMLEINGRSLDELLSRVFSWFEAMGKVLLVHQKNAK
jgi:hypothetical protein